MRLRRLIKKAGLKTSSPHTDFHAQALSFSRCVFIPLSLQSFSTWIGSLNHTSAVLALSEGADHGLFMVAVGPRIAVDARMGG